MPSSQKVFVRTPYNYDVDAASDETALICPEPSLAVQSAKDECDINKILDRWVATGELPPAHGEPRYGDFTGVYDYHTALNAVRAANADFMELDANIRARFNNDPGELLSFLSDEKNRDEAVKLGLISAPAEDLSIAGSERAPHAGGEPAVGKSGQRASASVRASQAASQGGEGDD